MRASRLNPPTPVRRHGGLLLTALVAAGVALGSFGVAAARATKRGPGRLALAAASDVPGSSCAAEPCATAGCEAACAAVSVPVLDLLVDPARPLSIEVAASGFSRELVRHVRFAFGDDFSAWGDHATHTYAAPGVYPVELEVVLDGERVLRASRLAVVGPLPADHEPVRLTVDRIPDYLNGSQPYHTNGGTPADARDDKDVPFHLLVPSQGFTVDVTLLETSDDPLDRTSLVLTADQDLGGGTLRAGTDLASRLRFDDQPGRTVPHASWLVGPGEAFPDGTVTLTVQARTASGATHVQTLRFETVALPPERQVWSRPMEWLLRFDMDEFTTTGRTHPDGRVSVQSKTGPDGLSDFAAELALLGAQGHDSAPAARSVYGRGATGASNVFRAWIERNIVEQVYRYFHMGPDGQPLDGISFRLFVDGEPGAPDPATFSPDGTFSVLRLGGSLDSGYLGRSYFGVFNHDRVDDSAAGVGIATGTILDALGESAGITHVFDPIKPGVGTPVGDDPADPIVLADGFDRHASGNTIAQNGRYDALARVARFVALALAHIVAHEMGHAMGLVPNGAPPEGFFGGRTDVSFMGRHTDSHHADYPALNLMQSGGNLVSTITSTVDHVQVPPAYDLLSLAQDYAYENRLSAYELAYLQGRLTYRNFNGSVAPAYGCR